MLPLESATAPVLDPEHKANCHGQRQAHTEHTGPPLIVVIDGTSSFDLARAPEEQPHAVEQRHHRENGKGPGRSEGDVVAKVEKRRRNRAEDDGELEL